MPRRMPVQKPPPHGRLGNYGGLGRGQIANILGEQNNEQQTVGGDRYEQGNLVSAWQAARKAGSKDNSTRVGPSTERQHSDSPARRGRKRRINPGGDSQHEGLRHLPFRDSYRRESGTQSRIRVPY